MNNITKALAYLLVLFLLLTGAGFMYHKQMEKANPTPTPTPDVTPTPEENPNPEGTVEDNGFKDQALEIYNAALQKYVNDPAVAGTEVVYCNVDGCTNNVDSTFEGYSFNVAVNNNNITKFYVTNGEYQFVYVGDNLDMTTIAGKKISEIDPAEVITITPSM